MNPEVSESREPRWAVVVSLIAGAILLSLHLLAIVKLADRPLHYDETEYLHASWLMAARERIYSDFFEDHPPHLFLVLNSVRPEAPEGDLQRLDVRAWTHRTRLLSGAFGIFALLAVMLVSWRISGSVAAGAIAGALLLCGPQIWTRGLSDVRAEPFTLALFWWGVLLILWKSDLSLATALRHGVGLGMLLVVALWNPKWPAVSLVAGVVYLGFLWRCARFRPRLLFPALIPAGVLLVAGLAPIFRAASWRQYVFFNFQLKARQLSELSDSTWMVEFFRRNPLWESADPLIRWWLVAAAVTLVAVVLIVRKRASRPAVRGWAVALFMTIASLFEVRFVYTYPHIWAQYLVMLAFTAALLYALLPTAVGQLLPVSSHRITTGLNIIVLAVASAFATMMLIRFSEASQPSARYWDAFWRRQAHLQASVPPGGTVWVSPPRHPIAARDASYYWYSFREAAPNAMAFERDHPESPLPSLQREDLPPCRLLREGGGGLALLEIGPWVSSLNICECAERVVGLEKMAPSPHFAIFEPARPDRGPRRIPRWYYESREVWPSLCAWKAFVADEREFERAARTKRQKFMNAAPRTQ